MNESIKKHYSALYKKHGNAPEAVQYSDLKSQYKRFEILTQISGDLGSVMDFGCGLAHLYDFLISRGFNDRYIGLDFVDDFIIANKNRFSQQENADFMVFDINIDEAPKGYDYVFLSGVFNNLSSDNESFMFNTLDKMYNACSKGVAFNAMSTYVDYQSESLYYSDPLKVFDYCKSNLTPKVTLRHDYLVKEGSIPFEYCIYLYK